jgi:hypothetical protein
MEVMVGGRSRARGRREPGGEAGPGGAPVPSTVERALHGLDEIQE